MFNQRWITNLKKKKIPSQPCIMLGIDHFYALKTINEVHSQGGKVKYIHISFPFLFLSIFFLHFLDQGYFFFFKFVIHLWLNHVCLDSFFQVILRWVTCSWMFQQPNWIQVLLVSSRSFVGFASRSSIPWKWPGFFFFFSLVFCIY